MTERRSNIRLSCPHCGAFARIRKSATLAPVYREAVVECQNADCGWRGRLSLELTHTLTPSRRPDPTVRLPLTPRAREAVQAQLEE